MSSLRAQTQKTLKTNNCRMVLRVLRDNRMKMISRADIAKETAMSPTSITRITRQLLDLDLVTQEEPFSTGVGRNGICICMNKDAFYSAGISIDSDYVKVCVTNNVDEVLAEAAETLEDRYYSPEEVLLKGKQVLDGLLEQKEIPHTKIQALGIACVGNVDYQTGYLHFASQMKWENVSISKLAEKIFGLITCVDNDVKMSLIGATYQFPEMRNSNSVYLSIGAGVGAAVMYEGKMIRGWNNAVGEVGHVHFSLDKRKCVCGRSACSYTYISTPALLKICCDKGHPMQNLEAFTAAVDAGEGWTEDVLEEYINYLAVFISDMIYIYNPQYMLVGGTVITSHPVFFDKVKLCLKDVMFDNLIDDVILKKRELSYNAALGAASAANEKQMIQLISNYD